MLMERVLQLRELGKRYFGHAKRKAASRFADEVYGNCEETISMQPVALAMMVFSPSALQASLTASASPQPMHARWPGANTSGWLINLVI